MEIVMKIPEHIECYRVQTGPYATRARSEFGLFEIHFESINLMVIASVGNDVVPWEHVSVTVKGKKYAPNYKIMQAMKELFWDDEDTVVQFHPKKSDYVNNHPYCLHLWKQRDKEFPTPPPICVGVKELGELEP